MTVAMDLGYTEVPCAVVDIDKTREKALNIALNKITGAWDDTLLADLLKDIEESNFDLGKTGFDPPEIEMLFNKVHSKEVKEDDFDVESELKQPCFSKEGDLWMLGKHRVLCGDSTKAECYDTLMDGVKANLVLSDPPYNVDVEETAGNILNDNMGDSEFYEFLLAAFKQMHGHLADDGSIYIFHADIAYYAKKKTNILNVVFTVFGAFYLMLLGTRGAALMMLLCVAWTLVLDQNSKKVFARIIVLCGAVAAFIMSPLYESFILWMYKTAQNLGLSVRIFDKLLSVGQMDSSGRDVLAETLITTSRLPSTTAARNWSCCTLTIW